MNIYETDDVDSLIDTFVEMVERDTKQKVFTMRVLERVENDQVKVLIVFEDKSILAGFITIQQIEDNIGLRLQGNFI